MLGLFKIFVKYITIVKTIEKAACEYQAKSKQEVNWR